MDRRAQASHEQADKSMGIDSKSAGLRMVQLDDGRELSVRLHVDSFVVIE